MSSVTAGRTDVGISRQPPQPCREGSRGLDCLGQHLHDAGVPAAVADDRQSKPTAGVEERPAQLLILLLQLGVKVLQLSLAEVAMKLDQQRKVVCR